MKEKKGLLFLNIWYFWIFYLAIIGISIYGLIEGGWMGAFIFIAPMVSLIVITAAQEALFRFSLNKKMQPHGTATSEPTAPAQNLFGIKILQLIISGIKNGASFIFLAICTLSFFSSIDPLGKATFVLLLIFFALPLVFEIITINEKYSY